MTPYGNNMITHMIVYSSQITQHSTGTAARGAIADYNVGVHGFTAGWVRVSQSLVL